MTWVILAVFAILTPWLFYCVNGLKLLLHTHVDQSVKRRRVSRGFLIMGLWQWSVAALLITMDGWTNAITLIGAGAVTLTLARWPIMLGEAGK